MKEIKGTLRPWQIEAENCEIEYLRNGGVHPLLAACPGSGKTRYGVRRACRFFNEDNGELTIVVVPTVNIKLGWEETFKHSGFVVTGEIENGVIRERINFGESIKGDFEVIVVTYAQLAKARELFTHYPKRYKTLVIADEIHHADDDAAYGSALTALAQSAHARLALSGTPFNSKGGALAMCDSEPIIDDQGQHVQRTIPFKTYSYAEALRDSQVCRMVEFGIVYGKATSTYQSLVTGDTFQRIVDLSRKRKDDGLRPLLDPDGEFLATMLDEGIKRLDAIKQHHRRAAMLVVAKTAADAGIIEQMLIDRCGTRYSTQLILHDTERAHQRIERLSKDNTDIVVTVRMISEGIDIKRFRVGIYASDALTRMFFVQFVGRFVRWDSDLDGGQYAVVIIPGHVKLVEYAREIEEMVIDAALTTATGGAEGDFEQKSVQMETETVATDRETMARGETMARDDEALLEAFFAQNPDMKGMGADSLIAQVLKRGQRGSMDGSSNEDENSQPEQNGNRQWREKNKKLVTVVVRLLKQNGTSDEDGLFKHVNMTANKQVGIRRVDSLVSTDILRARHAFLMQYARSLVKGTVDEDGLYE